MCNRDPSESFGAWHWRGTSGQEEQEPRLVEADRQLGLQTSSTRGGQSDVLLLSREEPRSGGTAESGGSPLKEESAAERPASLRPQQESDTHGSSAQLDSDAGAKEEVDRHKKVLTLRKPSSTEQLSALKTILPSHTSPLQMEREGGTCSFFSAKCDPSKHVPSFSLPPHTPLNDLTTLMCYALEATGGVQAPGALPKGALFK